MPPMIRRTLMIVLASTLSACGWFGGGEAVTSGPFNPSLFPNETPELRADINEAAGDLHIPAELIHRVIQRESGYNPTARNGPYYGLMQILPGTAATMGFSGAPSDLLDAQTNLRYAGAYLRGAWIVSDGDMDEAVHWYANGYYYEARNRCLLVETGLRETEVRC